ncbi:MAG: hypothetical protein ACSLFK_01630 [Gemmatimonadaceae bacterium]
MRIHSTIPLLILAITLAACARGRVEAERQTRTWYVPAVQLTDETAARLKRVPEIPDLGALVVLDSTSLRPVMVRRGGSGVFESRSNDSSWLVIHIIRPAVITTYQGGRYHPETVRALVDDTLVLALAARSTAVTARGMSLIVDFQGATPTDLPGMVEMVRSMGRFARPMGSRPIAMVVPPGDTVSYPTSILARVADILVIRLHGEHRPGTAPGPLTTPEFIGREIGLRARIVGASRLGAELPLFGYRWNANGTAVPITWVDAQALVRSESGAFTRDPASQFLTARGRDGWSVWVPDARTVQSMVAAVKRRGVTLIALSGVEGADPALFTTPSLTR